MPILSSRLLSSDGGKETIHSSPTSLIALFVFFGLLMGVIMRSFHKKTKIPYTPMLLVLGILASIAGEHIGLIGKATSLINEIEPSGILLIFIPILIFESSFNSDWHLFKRLFKQILLLAGPGVVIAFGLIAVTLKVILRYTDDEISWSSALMIGAIIATTDPVAIVALLKDIGAPHYFSTIIEGESLLNDGTGVVFFTIFSSLAAGNSISFGIGVASFTYLCVGGVALGLIFSMLTAKWLEKIFNDSILCISIMISASYLLYWVSETFAAPFDEGFNVNVSGILALCTLGLYLSAFRKNKISRKVEHPLHVVIHWAQYVAETLIFLLTGILVGNIFISEENHLLPSDWWKLIVFYFALNLIRAILILVLLPFLNKLGPKLAFKELFILSYAGLRGALGLSLALTVNANTTGFSQRTRELVLFYVAGIAALTLLVNGTTTGIIVKKIKMVKVFPAKEKIYRAFQREMQEVDRNIYENLREENPVTICDWETVRKTFGVTDPLPEEVAQEQEMDALHRPHATRHISFNIKVDDEELKSEARCRMLSIAKGLVWEQFENGQLETYGANILDKAIDIDLDALNTKINIFEFLHMNFSNSWYFKLITKLVNVPLIGKHFKNMTANHIINIYDATTSWVEIVTTLFDAVGNLPLQEHIIEAVLEEFNDDKKEAEAYISSIEEEFLEVMKFVNTRRFIVRAFISQKKIITERYNGGVIETKDYEKLIRTIDKKIQNLHKTLKVKWELPTFSSLMAGYPIFSVLTQEQTEKIVDGSTKMKFKKGDEVFKENTPFDGVYLITKGDVEISFNQRNYRMGVGHVTCLLNLVMFDNKSRVTCSALNIVETQKIELRTLRTIMQDNPLFEERVYKGALEQLRFMKPEKAPELGKLSKTALQAMLKNSELMKFRKDDKMKYVDLVFILKGKVKKGEFDFEEYCEVSSDNRIITAKSDGILLKFNTASSPARYESGSLFPRNLSSMSSNSRLPLRIEQTASAEIFKSLPDLEPLDEENASKKDHEETISFKLHDENEERFDLPEERNVNKMTDLEFESPKKTLQSIIEKEGLGHIMNVDEDS